MLQDEDTESKSDGGAAEFPFKADEEAGLGL